MLTEHNKTLRMKYALAQIDRSHGRKRIRFKDNKRTIMVDESWFYLTSDAVTVLLIEDMDALIHPKVQRKFHIEKIMFLAVLGQKVIWKGEEIDFDGKIGLFPCTEEVMMVNVMKAFEEYPREKIDGVWASWYNNLRSVMSCDGGNDYKQAHNGGKKRKRETGSAIDLTVNLVDYDRCVRLCR